MGDKGEDVVLTVSFLPTTSFAPSGQGYIEIGLPYLWEVNLQHDTMFERAAAQDSCWSNCMQITNQKQVGSVIGLDYDQMKPDCFRDS